MAEGHAAIAGLSDRLNQTSDLPSALETGFAVLKFIVAAAEACEVKRGRICLWWAMTAAEATEGWRALAAATSLPPGDASDPAIGGLGCDAAAAEVIAAMETHLATCLTTAVQKATNPGDLAACEHAARRAIGVRDLLSGSTR